MNLMILQLNDLRFKIVYATPLDLTNDPVFPKASFIDSKVNPAMTTATTIKLIFSIFGRYKASPDPLSKSWFL